MSRAGEFRDNVKSAWASQPEFCSRNGTLRAIAQHEGGVIVSGASPTQLNSADDSSLAQFGQWLVDTFGTVPDAK